MVETRNQIKFVKSHIKNELRLALSCGNLKTQVFTILKGCHRNHVFKSPSENQFVHTYLSELLDTSERNIRNALNAISEQGFIEKVSKYEIRVSRAITSMVKDDCLKDKPSDNPEIERIVERIESLIPSYQTSKIEKAKEDNMLRIELEEMKLLHKREKEHRINIQDKHDQLREEFELWKAKLEDHFPGLKDRILRLVTDE